MAWLLIELARAPALFDRLVEESVRVGTLPATPRDLRNHPFAEALFREAVRVHTPIPVLARMLIEDTSICGRNFAAGTRMLLPLAHLARDANRYPQPDTFHPDRWLERSEKPGPFETLPFGGGPHFCLGYHIAWMETVQFAVAFALHARRASVRPTFTGPPPRSVWFPLAAPSARVRVRLARTGA